MLWVELDRFSHAYIYLGLAISNPWQILDGVYEDGIGGSAGKEED